MMQSRLVVAVVALLWPSLCHANGSEVGFEAGSVFPLQSSNVRLVSERVDIDLSEALQGRVMCSYTLQNLSQERTAFSMAFISAPAYSGHPWDPGRYRSADLHASLGDTGLPIRWVSVDPGRWRDVIETPPDSLPTWDVSIDGGESVTLYINYKVSWSGGADGTDIGKVFTYYARPAALWADVIQEATITVRLGEPLSQLLQCRPSPDPCVEFQASPPGYVWFAGGLKWQFLDWEPDSDFRVSMDWTTDPY